MGLKSKVQASVDIAFDKLKDLAVTATFENKIVTGFNFSTGNLVNTDQTYTTIGFLGTTRTLEKGVTVTVSTLTIRNNPEIDINRYSTVTINDDVYNCSIVSEDDFIVILSLARV